MGEGGGANDGEREQDNGRDGQVSVGSGQGGDVEEERQGGEARRSARS